MWIDELKILFALEPQWTVTLNDREFLNLPSAEIKFHESQIQVGPYWRRIINCEWLRPDVVRIRARTRFRSRLDTITFYPGKRLPSYTELRRRRRLFQSQISTALCAYFGVRKIGRQTLYSDRRHGISGAYPRFLMGKYAVIAVDPDESSPIINGIMRAALLWAPLARRSVAIVVPYGRRQTLSARLRLMPEMRKRFCWLQWDGDTIEPLDEAAEPETCVHKFSPPDEEPEIDRICAIAPNLLQVVPHIAANAMSVRFRGIEVARVSSHGTTYPLGEPLDHVIRHLNETRRHGSRHPLARAYEERWLESNLMGQMSQVLPSVRGNQACRRGNPRRGRATATRTEPRPGRRTTPSTDLRLLR